MGVKHFVTALPERGLRTSWYYFREWALRNGPTNLDQWGSDIYEHDADWDVLVILDACRVDLMEAVAPDYDWLPNTIETVESPAGSSKEWMERTFQTDPAPAVSETAYVTGNPFSDTVFDDDHPFAVLDEVWRDSWDDDLGTIRPGSMIDHAISTGRSHDGPIVVHMMQPHIPFISDPSIHPGFDARHWGSPDATRDDSAVQRNVWQQLRAGDLERDEVWPAYADNLRLALDEVDRLRENIDGRLVLSADHGNAMGEHGVYGHPDLSIDPIKTVPWVSVEASDEHTSHPDVTAGSVESSVADRLEALGYMEDRR